MSAPEPLGVLGSVLLMQQAATPDQAQAAARLFYAASGSAADTAALLTEWAELHDQQVQQIESTAVTRD